MQGRNDFAIFVMTRELGILTWDEAFLSLRSTLLPDALRAKYCELIIGQYIQRAPCLNANSNSRSVCLCTPRHIKSNLTRTIREKWLIYRVAQNKIPHQIICNIFASSRQILKIFVAF